jgi:RNA polymerase sigma-70 factor (ECF subfamily)
MTDAVVSDRLSDWFLQWRSPLRQFLRARGAVPNADVEDVAQEVFLRLMRYNRTELIEHPQAYLYKVASNVANEWSSRARLSRPHESSWLAELSATQQPDQDAAVEEIQKEVKRAVELLKPRHREILRLYYSEGLGHSEIAERLGITKRSVKRALIKSYGSLRQELDPGLLGRVPDGRRDF